MSFNGFLKLKLWIPSPKDELLHRILLLRNVDHDILQKRHLKSLITIANLFDVVISIFSNLLWNPFNITTLLVIYIEDCRPYGSSQWKQEKLMSIFLTYGKMLLDQWFGYPLNIIIKLHDLYSQSDHLWPIFILFANVIIWYQNDFVGTDMYIIELKINCDCSMIVP